MTVLIIASIKDPASINIKNHLLKQANWEEIETFNENPVFRHSKMKDIILITINDQKITHENLDKEIEKKLKIKAKQAIFISRHTSQTGKPSLTVHPIGNYGEAQFGGGNRTLCKSSPRLMSQLLRNINKNAKEKNLYHQICLEVTHHGPYISIPSLFVEIGSNEEEWEKEKPAEVIASSLLDLLELYHYEEDFTDDIPVVLGVGGGHYAPRFTDVILEKKVAFGHMIPRYHIDSGNINDEMFEKAIQATPNVTAVYLHRKSLKKAQIREYKDWFKKRGIPAISSKELIDL